MNTNLGRKSPRCLIVLTLCGALMGSLSAQAVDPLEIALAHLNANAAALGLTADDLADKVVTDQYQSRNNSITHIHFRQRLAGIEVANGNINVNVSVDGRVISVGNRFVGNLAGRVNRRSHSISAADAIGQAAGQLGLSISGLSVLETVGGPAQEARFNGAGISLDDIPVKLSYYRTDQGAVRLSWEMVIRQTDQQHWWNLWVDAENGDILARVDWIANDTYEAYAVPKESPSDGPRTLETNPADATASPFGWHDTGGDAGAEFTTTRGNNVCAQQDQDGNNSPCGSVAQPDGGASLDFQFSLDLNQQPSAYVDAAVTNLFYWNNIMHDVLYQYGFDEASGNFQENNYGRGGIGSDSVNADAQDGSGTNNANFATPPEPNGPFSTNPRMQMFEWTPPNINEVVVDAPSSSAGSYGASSAEFGPPLDATGVFGAVVAAIDGVGTTTDGCEALTNGGAIFGNIALIDRGSCTFVTKARNSQNAGAAGVIIVNNVPGAPIEMGDDGTGGDITIPSVMVSQSDGATIRSGLPATGTIRRNPSPPPNRDSDLDNGIIAHEYCHGLSRRLTGGPASSSCLSGRQQAGEGWSDLCTLFMTPDVIDTATTARGVGTYANFEPSNGGGSRPFPYTTDIGVNPLTYGDIVTAGQAGGLSIPHGVGTVWATAVWEMYWNLVDAYGFDPDLYNGAGGNNTAIQLMVDGLKLQPCNPTFLDARDAVLLADQQNNGGANECLIWEAFAKRGMGVNANDGGSSNALDVNENFEFPAQCVVGCGNAICETGEDCVSCPSDCVSGSTNGAVCGNGVCEAGNGEDCVSCPTDCNGRQNGRPSNRFCCGDGGGQNPILCSANDGTLCNQGDFSCTDVVQQPGTFCCGWGSCESGESCSNCALDCTIAGGEVCDSGIDEDCDGQTDCDDSDCASFPACITQCVDVDQACSKDADCCSGNCSNGRPSTRVCLAN